MAEKRHRIIENVEVDQYLEAQGYTKYDTTINMEIWCITSTGKLASIIWWWMDMDWDAACAGYSVTKDTMLALDLSQVSYHHISPHSSHRRKCICTCLHTCAHKHKQDKHECAHIQTEANVVFSRSGGPLSRHTLSSLSLPMLQTTSGAPHPSPAFTSGLLKMISAHGGQALAFAFYWKHGDLEQRIYQLWADRIS